MDTELARTLAFLASVGFPNLVLSFLTHVGKRNFLFMFGFPMFLDKYGNL